MVLNNSLKDGKEMAQVNPTRARTFRETIVALGTAVSLFSSGTLFGLPGCGGDVPTITSSKKIPKNVDGSVDGFALPSDSQVLADGQVSNDSIDDAFDDDANSVDAEISDARADSSDANVSTEAGIDGSLDGKFDALIDARADAQRDAGVTQIDSATDAMGDAIDAPIPDANDGSMVPDATDANPFTEAGVDGGVDAPIDATPDTMPDARPPDARLPDAMPDTLFPDAMIPVPDAPIDMSMPPIDSAPDMSITPPDRPNDILSPDRLPVDARPPDTMILIDAMPPDAMADARMVDAGPDGPRYSGYRYCTPVTPTGSSGNQFAIQLNSAGFPVTRPDMRDVRLVPGSCSSYNINAPLPLSAEIFDPTGAVIGPTGQISLWSKIPVSSSDGGVNDAGTSAYQYVLLSGSNTLITFNPSAVFDGNYGDFITNPTGTGWLPFASTPPAQACTFANNVMTCTTNQKMYLPLNGISASSMVGKVIEVRMRFSNSDGAFGLMAGPNAVNYWWGTGGGPNSPFEGIGVLNSSTIQSTNGSGNRSLANTLNRAQGVFSTASVGIDMNAIFGLRVIASDSIGGNAVISSNIPTGTNPWFLYAGDSGTPGQMDVLWYRIRSNPSPSVVVGQTQQ